MKHAYKAYSSLSDSVEEAEKEKRKQIMKMSSSLVLSEISSSGTSEANDTPKAFKITSELHVIPVPSKTLLI